MPKTHPRKRPASAAPPQPPVPVGGVVVPTNDAHLAGADAFTQLVVDVVHPDGSMDLLTLNGGPRYAAVPRAHVIHIRA